MAHQVADVLEKAYGRRFDEPAQQPFRFPTDASGNPLPIPEPFNSYMSLPMPWPDRFEWTLLKTFQEKVAASLGATPHLSVIVPPISVLLPFEIAPGRIEVDETSINVGSWLHLQEELLQYSMSQGGLNILRTGLARLMEMKMEPDGSVSMPPDPENDLEAALNWSVNSAKFKLRALWFVEAS